MAKEKEIAQKTFSDKSDIKKNNPVSMDKGKSHIGKRADFQETAMVETQQVFTREMSHEERMDAYRDRTLSMLIDAIEPALFKHFDERSETSLGMYKPNTEIAIYSDLLQYLDFCKESSITPIPFNKTNVVPYLEVISKKCKRGTIDRRIASLAKWCDIMEWDDPRSIYEVKSAIAKVRTRMRKSKKQAAGLRLKHLITLLETLNPMIPRDCQDVALLWTAFEIMSRESELVALNWEDLEIDEDGTGTLSIIESKTDKEGEGALQYVSAGTVRLLENWKKVSGASTGPIFRGVYSNGKLGDRLSTRGVDRCVKRVAKALNLEPSIFSGHSMRVGAAQEMVEEGIDSAKIVIAGRWSNDAMLVHYAKKINAKRGAMAELTGHLKLPTPKNNKRKETLDDATKELEQGT